MLNQYGIQFIGKISWEGQSNGLPAEISGWIICETEGGASEKQIINNIIEQQTAAFFHLGGMPVQRDQGQMIDLRTVPQDRVVVPMQWIVNISVKLHPLGAELTTPDEHGVERFKNGQAALKN